MPRKPRSDSHKYLYRDLPKSRKQVKVLIAYLEENQEGIKFWSKDSQVLIERAKYGPPVIAEDIPETVEPEHRQNIADLLNGVLAYYVDLRQKRTDKKAELETLRQQIPKDERERLKFYFDKLTAGAYWHFIFNSNEGKLINLAGLSSFSAVNEWLNKADSEKVEVFNTLQNLYNRYLENEQQWQEEFKRWENSWRDGLNQFCGTSELTKVHARSTLEVSNTANKDEIKAAWRRKVKQTHPDAGGNTYEFQKVQDAYKVLTGCSLT